MPDDGTITLILPEGSWDYPSSHGVVEYYPYRLDIDHQYPARDNGGPWAIDVPFDVYPYFRKAGYLVMEPDQDAEPTEGLAMKRLRKVGGGDASCNWGGRNFEPDAEGMVTVPHTAVGELVESHGYEEVSDPLAQIDAGLDQIHEAIAAQGGHGEALPEAKLAQIDAGLDQVHEGVAAQGERVEALREEALAQVPEDKAEAARAEVEAAKELDTHPARGRPATQRK